MDDLGESGNRSSGHVWVDLGKVEALAHGYRALETMLRFWVLRYVISILSLISAAIITLQTWGATKACQ